MQRGFARGLARGSLILAVVLSSCTAPRIPASYGLAAGSDQVAFLFIQVGRWFLVLDSGTRSSYVTADFATALGWTRTEAHRSAVGLEGAVTEFREVVSSPHLVIGGFSMGWDEAWILVTDLPQAIGVVQVPGLVFGGLLGRNALHDVSLSFGPDGAILSRDHPSPGLELDVDQLAWVTIDGAPEPVVIDTGYSGQLVRLKPKGDPFRPTTRPVVMTPWLDRIFPGRTEALSPLEYVDLLTLGTAEFRDLTLPTIVVSDSPDPRLPSQRLLLGLEMLRGGRATVDFAHHQLALSSTRLVRNDVDRLAVRLSPAPQGWTIDSILRSHPAYAVGRRPGFRVEAPHSGNEWDAILFLANLE